MRAVSSGGAGTDPRSSVSPAELRVSPVTLAPVDQIQLPVPNALSPSQRSWSVGASGAD